MLMNEKEAEAKWCPFARQSTGNRDELIRLSDMDRRIEGSPLCRCITTACMAWNWHDAEKHYPAAGTTSRQSRPAFMRDGDEDRWAREGDEAKAQRQDDVPATWVLVRGSESNPLLYWTEPAEERDARLAEAKRTWPERRRGFCALMEPKS